MQNQNSINIVKSSNKLALKIMFIYILVGASWILFSDILLMELSKREFTTYRFFQHYKGWFYVAVTGALLYILISRYTQTLLRSKEKLIKKEYQLQSSEQHYKSLFQHNPDGVYKLNRAGEFISINPAGEKITGYQAEELIGRNYQDYIVKEEVEAVKCHFASVYGSAECGKRESRRYLWNCP